MGGAAPPRLTTRPVADTPAIELRGLTRHFGERTALRDVSVSVPAGATLAVLGRNGAGKSTLLRILATLLRPHGGEIALFGESLPGRAFAVRGRLGLLAHEPLLYTDLTARENLRYHASLHGVERERVEELLGAVGMEPYGDEPVRLLSRGMVQRIAVCRAVLHRPALLLLDEPRANLDPAASDLLEPLIGRASGCTRVITSHDPRAALAEADLVLGLKDGRPLIVAEAREIADAQLSELYHEDRAAVLRKDLLLELRTLETVPAMVLFSLATFVIFHFALNRETIEGQLAAGVLTATLLFAAMLAINRLFVAEREQGGFDAFLLAPVDRTALLIAKASALFAFLAVLEVIAVPAFAVLLLGPPIGPSLLGLIAVLALADLALAVVGTLVSAIAVHTRARDLIGPVIGLPLLIPALIATARATGPLLRTHASGSPPGKWLAVLALYDLVFVLLAYGLFDFLLED